jgi:hypothetical protein
MPKPCLISDFRGEESSWEVFPNDQELGFPEFEESEEDA